MHDNAVRLLGGQDNVQAIDIQREESVFSTLEALKNIADGCRDHDVFVERVRDES